MAAFAMSALQAASASQAEILRRYFGVIGDLAMRPTGLPCLRAMAYAHRISLMESARIILEGLMEAASA